MGRCNIDISQNAITEGVCPMATLLFVPSRQPWRIFFSHSLSEEHLFTLLHVPLSRLWTCPFSLGALGFLGPVPSHTSHTVRSSMLSSPVSPLSFPTITHCGVQQSFGSNGKEAVSQGGGG